MLDAEMNSAQRGGFRDPAVGQQAAGKVDVLLPTIERQVLVKPYPVEFNAVSTERPCCSHRPRSNRENPGFAGLVRLLRRSNDLQALLDTQPGTLRAVGKQVPVTPTTSGWAANKFSRFAR